MGIEEKLIEMDVTQTHWHVTHFIVHRKKLFMFVHMQTGYPVFLYGIKPKDYKHIGKYFKDALKESLLKDNFCVEAVEQLIASQGDLSFSKTTNRGLIGNTNYISKFVIPFSNLIHPDQLTQALMTHEMATFLVKNDQSPIRLMQKLLEQYIEHPNLYTGIEVQVDIDLEDGVKVRRTLLLPHYLNLNRLHVIIQIVFGWHGYHLHEFVPLNSEDIYQNLEIENDYISPKSTHNVTIMDAFQINPSWIYTYDFGDDWQHNITFVRSITNREPIIPQCTQYEGENIPEDCGGVMGYRELIEILQDQDHPDYEALKEWYDSIINRFDLDTVNTKLKYLFF